MGIHLLSFLVVFFRHLLSRCCPSIHQGKTEIMVFEALVNSGEMANMVFYATFVHISSSHQGATELSKELPESTCITSIIKSTNPTRVAKRDE